MSRAASDAACCRPPRRSAPIASGDLNFSRDGKGLFLSTDRDGEFRKLAFLDLATGKLDYFGEGGNWDVESIALSPDGRVLAVITNEAGIGVLRLYDAATRKPLPRPRCRPATCTASCGTRTRAISRSRSTARKARATPTESTCATTSSRAGRRRASPDSTLARFATPSRSNGRASTAGRSAAS